MFIFHKSVLFMNYKHIFNKIYILEHAFMTMKVDKL